MKKFLLSMLGVLIALPGIARDFTYEYEGQTLTYTVIDEEAKTCMTKEGDVFHGGNNVSGELVIPSVVKNGNNEYAVTSIGQRSFDGCSDLTTVTIPNSVTSIGEYAFALCRGLTSVTIPNSVTTIDKGAFYNCSRLTSVTIPNSVRSIGESTFDNCAVLTSVTIGHSVTSIGYRAFSNCSGLTSVIIPNSVTEIGGSAFIGCSGLNSVTIPNSVLSIGGNAFSDCTGLTSVSIGHSVTSIGYMAFSNCSGLTSVIIPNSVTEIGKSVFKDCNKLQKSAYPSGFDNPFSSGVSIRYPRDGAIIEDGFVYGPEKNAIYFAPLSLEGEYIIPNSVTKIGYETFYSCSGLTSVIIPNSVTSIGDRAFQDCSGLTSVIIPNFVTEIGSYPFLRCNGLQKSAFPSGLSSPDLGSPFQNGAVIGYPREGAIIEDGFIYGPEKNAIYFAPLSLEGEYIVPNSVTSIGNSAFCSCRSLTSVTIGPSVTSIDQYAFYLCSGLTSIIATNVYPPLMDGTSFLGLYDKASLSVPDDAATAYLSTNWSLFQKLRICNSEIECTTYETGNLKYRLIPAKTNDGKNLAVVVPGDYSSLTEVTIPERFTVSDNGTSTRYYVDGIGYKAFNGSGLSTVTFNSRNACRFIGDYAFAESGISSLTIPNTVEAIGNSAFYHCLSLTDIDIPGSVKTVGDYAFYDCYRLRYVKFQEGSATIGNSAFLMCSDLETVHLGKGVSSIGARAFDQCESLVEITIPGSVKTIGAYAFNDCIALTKANLEAGVKTIGEYAFYNTSALIEVTFNEGLESIGAKAFYRTHGKVRLNPLFIPSTLKSVGEEAFYNSHGISVNISDLTAWCNIDFADFNSNPASLALEGLYLNGEKIEDLVIPESVNAIKDYAFSYNSTLKSVTCSDALQSIGASAFRGCNGLQTVTFNDALQSIDTSAFSGCSGLQTVTFNNALQSIAASAFNGCRGLQTVTFNDALQSIGASAFNGCSGLTTAVIPGNVTVIGDNAFTSTNVYDLTFAYGAKPIEIASDAFQTPTSLSWDRPIESLNLGINSLKILTIGNSITEIPTARFRGVTRLATLTLGNSLTAIGDEAFSGCTALTEVILPPSVETIGASAFAGNTKLTSIIMGHNVTTIGEKAYDLCPAQTVSITAQTPPAAPDNTFSNYTGNLYVQGETAAKAYYDADFCWYQFEGHVMIEPTEMKVEGDKVLNGKPGDTFQLTATLYPTDVTLPQVFWRSTNPDIATVDANGLVTIHADLDEVMALAVSDDEPQNSCMIIAESLYANGPVAQFNVTRGAGVDDVTTDSNLAGDIDYNAPVEVYNMQGVMVGRSLDNVAAGIYIVRQGNIVKKIAVK